MYICIYIYIYIYICEYIIHLDFRTTVSPEDCNLPPSPSMVLPPSVVLPPMACI